MQSILIAFLTLQTAIHSTASSVTTRHVGCGRRLVQHEGLITSGSSTKEGDWPWVAAINHVFGVTSTYKCVGTLLNSNTVLTAAHCVYENDRKIIAERVTVQLGKYHLLLSGVNTQEFQVHKITSHPDFDPSNLENDIAIIHLSTEATFDNYVQPICLWQSDRKELSEVIGKVGVVSGWGLTETDQLSSHLKYTYMPVVSFTTCLGSNRQVFGNFLSDKNFCAGFRNGSSACSGDSGGSLAFEENGVYHIRGIVSLSAARGNTGFCSSTDYVLFTDVAQYLAWIQNVVPDLNSSLDPQVKDEKTTIIPPTVSENWDNDDFVPHRSNRHDEFDWRLTKALMLSDQSNMIFSPFSIKLLLSGLFEAAGIDTSTHKEISAVLPSVRILSEAREFYGIILGSLLEKSSDYNLHIGNRIYLDKSITPRLRYVAIMETYYLTKVENLDFNEASESAKIINDWCANITQNHFRDTVKSGDIKDSVMIMLNALYFDGYWRRPLAVRERVEIPFYVTPATQVETSFMVITDSFYYMESKTLNAQILRMPYKGHKYSMTIILPNAKSGLDDLIRQLDSTTLHRAQWLMSKVLLQVQIPKFKFDYTSDLNDVLKDIGIRSIFSNEASFPALARGATTGRVQVSKILQKAGIYAKGKGSTLYVPTYVTFVNGFVGNDSREFIADRPFVFIIEDETTGTLLFAGKVTDPNTFTT